MLNFPLRNTDADIFTEAGFAVFHFNVIRKKTESSLTECHADVNVITTPHLWMAFTSRAAVQACMCLENDCTSLALFKLFLKENPPHLLVAVCGDVAARPLAFELHGYRYQLKCIFKQPPYNPLGSLSCRILFIGMWRSGKQLKLVGAITWMKGVIYQEDLDTHSTRKLPTHG